MVQRVTDRLGRRATGRQFGDLGVEPDPQGTDQRLALSLTHGQSLGRGLAANARLNRIERANALQGFDRDRCLRLGQIIETPPHVTPAKRQYHRGIGGFRPAQLLVGSIAVALQNAAVIAQQRRGVDISAARRVAVDHRGR